MTATEGLFDRPHFTAGLWRAGEVVRVGKHAVYVLAGESAVGSYPAGGRAANRAISVDSHHVGDLYQKLSVTRDPARRFEAATQYSRAFNDSAGEYHMFTLKGQIASPAPTLVKGRSVPLHAYPFDKPLPPRVMPITRH